MTTGSDGYPLPGGPSTPPDYLGPATPARRSRRKPVLVAVCTATLLVVGGGAFAAYSFLNGGGPQPEDALPGNVVGYAEIDLDPAAGQKVNAYRLAKRFPDAKVTGEGSLKDDLLRQLFEEEEGVDYDNDVKPWVGDRAGIAFLDELDVDDEPVPVAALQYTDRGKAEAGLKRLTADSEDTAYAFGADDYVVIAETQAIADQAVADAKRSPLSDNRRYTDAVDALGGDQVAVLWADVEGIVDLVPEDVLADAGPFSDLEAKGSYVLGVSVRDDAVEIKGKGLGIDLGELGNGGLTQGGPGQLLTQLPADSLVAGTLSGAGKALTATYDQLVTMSEDDEDLADFLDLADEVGLDLPGDITALLGDELSFAALAGEGDEPDIGARTRGGDPERGLEVLQRIIGYVSDQDPSEIALDGIVEELEGGLVAGSQPEVLDEVGRTGKLGESDSFRKAVADPDAPFAVYVDLAGLFDTYGSTEFELSSAERKNVEPLDAVGLSADGDEFTLRVTFR